MHDLDTELRRRVRRELGPILRGEHAITLHAVHGEERLRLVPVKSGRGTVLPRAVSLAVIDGIAEGFVDGAEHSGDGASGDGASAVPELDAAPGFDPIRDPSAEWSGIVEVTPELARVWLKRNTDNRPLSRSTVRRYTKLMGAGRWLVSADAVAFDTAGKLVNGQHRLHAVVQHGQPVPMLVATGLSPAVFAVLDGGKPRSGGDVLAIRGFKHAVTCAAVVRLAAKAKAGGLWTGGGDKLELDELVRRAEDDRERVEAAAVEGYRIYDLGRDTGRVLNPAHTAFAVYAAAKAGGDAAHGPLAARFLTAVATGLGIAALDAPAHQVRQAFLDDQRADVPMGRAERLAILIRGLQHALAGEPMKRARGRGAGAWPSPAVPGWPKQRSRSGASRDAAGAPALEPVTIDDPKVHPAA